MTEEEIKAINFKLMLHMSKSDEHITTYDSECGRFGKCVHVPFRNGEPYGRSYTHYRIGDKIHKTKEKFIEALKEL